MFKAAAKSQHFLDRTGSYSTHGSRRGVVFILPDLQLRDNFDPSLFDSLRRVAVRAINIMSKNHGLQFEPGAATAAAYAACEHRHKDRARKAMREMLKQFVRQPRAGA